MSRGFFTKVFESPHPAIPERWVAAIHLALEQSLSLIRSEDFELKNAKEDEITYALEQILENRSPNLNLGLDLSFIRSVTRESASANFDESSIGRKPDLVIRLNRELSQNHNRTRDCIFAECKPVDKKHKLKDHYCAVGKSTSGIERFVNGAYASSMLQGMMIAYVRDGFRIETDLAKAFSLKEAQAGLGEPSDFTCVVASDNEYCQGLYSSVHHRNFTWENGSQASPIIIYHSWHES